MYVTHHAEKVQVKPFGNVISSVQCDTLIYDGAKIARPAVINAVYYFDGFVFFIHCLAVIHAQSEVSPRIIQLYIIAVGGL